LLLVHGYVPVIASLGLEEGGAARVLNVNADVMACRVAAALGGADLVIAGATAGVLDAAGKRIDALDAEGIDTMISSGTATAGMIAKLNACRAALLDGVRTVRIVDGRQLESVHDVSTAPGTSVFSSMGTLR